ncbi:SigE family RNA polymerase sigma factor [Nocardioides lianchengensis]|uniref:RNA polymerase sigma-70 factor, sigma-E family n=1 Tax=Nocardioides lianchengensis TaxID=1045774 RepID=A0A1G6PUF7_9ACTN|nr:SigE family RNA polymerase sigma factor [Nocardioides lianchengensis]NYG11985.1 RNA polymerase sigma-70 factor (sigma-E family) [Nocardioides lianchengensis]SDC83719.1 RNA polymerase sigma-70 factor, sigma-E family [Nocardioides lianchengensis]
MISRADQRSFETFVHDASDRLLRTAYLLTGDRGHAEDLVQTALLRTARRWSTARRDPAAYARRVVVNLAKDRWRDLRRRPGEAPLEVDVAVPVTDGVADRDRLLRAARQLPAGQRAVLVLRYFDDLSVADTAAALGCSEGTVKSQTARALDRLRSVLAPTKENADADRR